MAAIYVCGDCGPASETTVPIATIIWPGFSQPAAYEYPLMHVNGKLHCDPDDVANGKYAGNIIFAGGFWNGAACPCLPK
jgi:hypothetical protein